MVEEQRWSQNEGRITTGTPRPTLWKWAYATLRPRQNVNPRRPQLADSSAGCVNTSFPICACHPSPGPPRDCRTPWHQSLSLGEDLYLQDMRRTNSTQEVWYTHRQTYYILWANHSPTPQQHKHPQDRNTPSLFLWIVSAVRVLNLCWNKKCLYFVSRNSWLSFKLSQPTETHHAWFGRDFWKKHVTMIKSKCNQSLDDLIQTFLKNIKFHFCQTAQS